MRRLAQEARRLCKTSERCGIMVQLQRDDKLAKNMNRTVASFETGKLVKPQRTKPQGSPKRSFIDDCHRKVLTSPVQGLPFVDGSSCRPEHGKGFLSTSWGKEIWSWLLCEVAS